MTQGKFQPFSASDSGKSINGHYPSKIDLISALCSMPFGEYSNFIRMWMLEGIPHAFSRSPIFFDVIRNWFSERTGIPIRDITLIGSSRIGYSLAPGKYGKEFAGNSDIDLCAVSEGTFSTIVNYYKDWETSYEKSDKSKLHPRLKELWDENVRVCRANIDRGFIDLNKIRPVSKYEKLVQINDALFLLHEKAKVTPEIPQFKSVTLRLYKNWESLVRQNRLNLSILVKRHKVEEQIKSLPGTPQ